MPVREIYAGETAPLQFNVWNTDGVTKKSGLVQPGNFTVSVWHDGAVDAVVAAAVLAAILEIGTSGAYKSAFAPGTGTGYWRIEIVNTWSTDVMGEAFEVRAVRTLGVG